VCLILIAWQTHPDYPLIVAANRDEFFARPSVGAAFWPDSPEVFAGRDLEAGGTWLGISRQGRFAALTNFRESRRPSADAPSRGMLTADFLTGCMGLDDYLAQVTARAGAFNGFNLLLGDGKRLGYLSNRHSSRPTPIFLEPGIYGLSNHLLDTPWPKLTVAKKAFAGALAGLPDTHPFFDLLADDEIVPDAHLPNTGVPPHWERVLSAIFVKSPDYGTRASTVLCAHHSGRVVFEERLFGPEAACLGHLREEIQSSSMSTGV